MRYTTKDYDKAIADCTESIRLDPKSAETYISRRNAWYKKGAVVRHVRRIEPIRSVGD